MANYLATVIADFESSLATKLEVGGTSVSLQSATDDDGVSLPAGRYFFTIDAGRSNKEHIVGTLSGTTLSSIKTVSRQGAETSGAVREHRVGAKVTITNFGHLKRIVNLLDGTDDLDASTPLSYDGTATISNANELATKAYVDGVAIAGGADASTTVKGLTKMSVAPASATEPIAVGDNDPRVPTSAQVGYIPTSGQKDALAGSSGTPGTTNTYVTTDDVSSSGTLGKIVRATGTALPALSAVNLTNLPLVSGSGSTTKNLSDASTTQNIAHGLGRTPKIFTLFSSASTGNSANLWYNAQSLSGQSQTVYKESTSTGGSSIPTFSLFSLSNTASECQLGVVTADATNITITWTKNGSPTGTRTIIWHALA